MILGTGSPYSEIKVVAIARLSGTWCSSWKSPTGWSRSTRRNRCARAQPFASRCGGASVCLLGLWWQEPHDGGGQAVLLGGTVKDGALPLGIASLEVELDTLRLNGILERVAGGRHLERVGCVV